MIISILLKEWLKLRWFFFASLVLNLAVCTKIFFDIHQRMQAEHAEMVWYQVIHLHSVLYQEIRLLPLLTGLVLAVVQFVPEILGRRLRLALHLPMGRDGMLAICLLSGLSLYLLIATLDVAAVYWMLSYFFPVEVAHSSLSTMAPWLFAGLITYFGSVTVLLETSWPRRVFLLQVFAVLLSVLFQGAGYGWFAPSLSWLAALLPLAMLCVFESGRRFQQGGIR